MDWTQVLTVFFIIGTNLATIITLYMHLDNKSSAMIKAIYDDMKDFHARMEKQDAEFRGKFLLIEEKIKKT